MLGWILYEAGDLAGAARQFSTATTDPVPEVRASATKGMDAQSSVHLLVMLCIVLGNLAHWAARRLGER